MTIEAVARWFRWLFRRGKRGVLLLNMQPGDRVVSMIAYRKWLAVVSERGEVYLISEDRLVQPKGITSIASETLFNEAADEIERLTAELAEANGDIDHSIENGQKLRAEIAALRSTLRACRALRQLDEELAALIEPALAGAADETFDPLASKDHDLARQESEK